MSRDANPDRLYVSAPFKTPLGLWAMSLGRVILDGQGRFNGYLLAILDPDYFRLLLTSILYAPDMRVSVIHGEGKVVFRTPDPEGLTGQDVRQLPHSFYRRFRELFEHLPIAYQSVDNEGRWLDINQPLADLLGFACPEEMLGLSFIDYWDESIRDQFDASYARFKANLSIDGEVPLRRRGGSPVTVLFAGRIQTDEQGPFLRTHCILFDISERWAMEEEIRALKADLEAKVAARTAAVPAASAAPPLDPARHTVLREALRRHDLAASDHFEVLAATLTAAWGAEASQTLGQAIADLRFGKALAQLDTLTSGPAA